MELICKSEFFKKLKLQELLQQVQFQLSKNSQVQLSNLSRKTYDYNTNMKKFTQKKSRKMFLEAIFLAFENFSQSFRTKFLSLFYMRSLAYKISYCLSVNLNPELRCVIYTGVTLFALVLYLNCTTLS